MSTRLHVLIEDLRECQNTIIDLLNRVTKVFLDAVSAGNATVRLEPLTITNVEEVTGEAEIQHSQ